jgi:hypothetical protein
MKQKDHIQCAYWFPSPRPEGKSFCSRLRLTAETQIGVEGRLEVTKYSIHRDDSHHGKVDQKITVSHIEGIELRFNSDGPAATSLASLQRIDEMLW